MKVPQKIHINNNNNNNYYMTFQELYSAKQKQCKQKWHMKLIQENYQKTKNWENYIWSCHQAQ